MADERTLDRLVVVGASHRTSSEATRDRLFISEDDLPAFLRKVSDAGFSSLVAMATCARTEIFGFAENPAMARNEVMAALARLGSFDIADLEPQTYFYSGDQALSHLFRVASSMDSPIVGEPEVTGQFRDAVRIAEAYSFISPDLDTVIQTVNRVAKRVRSETLIGERPVSMAACAIQVARDVHGDLSDVRALLVSGGEMGELIVDHLVQAGLTRLTVVARSRVRAEISARRYDCHHGTLDDFPDLLPETDILISSLGAGNYLVDLDNAETALLARRRHAMLFVDAAIPPDVNPTVNGLDGAFVYALDDLERLAFDGRSRRDEAATRADIIVAEETSAFAKSSAERGATPAVTALRSRFEETRLEILSEGVGDKDETTRLLINRLLHEPSENLRRLAVEHPERAEEAENLLRRLFGIDGGNRNTRE
jgi:glutamyl-tRNA reductase